MESLDEAALYRAGQAAYEHWTRGRMAGVPARRWEEMTPHAQQFWIDMFSVALGAANEASPRVVRIPFLGKTTNRKPGGNDEGTPD